MTRIMYKPGQDITGHAATVITAGHLVTCKTARTNGNITVTHTVAGDHPLGVAGHDTAAGKLAHIYRGGIAAIATTGTITAGTPVTTAADGTIAAADTGELVVGLAVDTTTDGATLVALT